MPMGEGFFNECVVKDSGTAVGKADIILKHLRHSVYDNRLCKERGHFGPNSKSG